MKQRIQCLLRPALRFGQGLLLAGLAGCSESGSISEKSGIIDETRQLPPFTLHTQGHWTQALWGPLQVSTSTTIEYRGQAITQPGTAYTSFDWMRPLPHERVLLGQPIKKGGADIFWWQFYVLDVVAGRPRMQYLGLCDSGNHMVPVSNPDLRLTADSLGLLVPVPDTVRLEQFPSYRFFDLRTPATYTALPYDLPSANGVPYTPLRLGWSPDYRQVVRTYKPDYTTSAGLAFVVDRRTGRQQRLPLPDASDTTASPAGFDQLRWQPAGGTYRLVHR